jgi:hypothetical protein
MQRIQYQRYGGPEEMRLETDELPPSANMFMIRAPFPRAIGTDFSGVLESIGSSEGRVHPHVAYVLAQGNIALDHAKRTALKQSYFYIILQQSPFSFLEAGFRYHRYGEFVLFPPGQNQKIPC